MGHIIYNTEIEIIHRLFLVITMYCQFYSLEKPIYYLNFLNLHLSEFTFM